MSGSRAARLRARFDRAARGYEAAAHLDAEVARRMLERLDYVRQDPERILDAGAGTGRDARALARRYPGATVVALDLSPAMLRAARAPRGIAARLMRRALPAVCAEMERIPLASASIDFAWSNLALHWSDDPRAALGELARVLRPGGLLMFSACGPDTLRALADASTRAFGASRVRRFVDMHDLGDMLVAAGMADPVMDAERITLTYEDVRKFYADLRATANAADPDGGLTRGLRGRARLAALSAALEASRSAGRIEIAFEIVYGHAWKAVPTRTAQGHAIVRAPIAKRGAR